MRDTMHRVQCQSCRSVAGEVSLTLGTRIDLDEHWMIEHCDPVSMAGWFVLVLKRHARALHELTDDEWRSFGAWMPRIMRAMHAVSGCEVEYVVQFAEGPGFAHVHFHLMPRGGDWPEGLRGPRVFGAFGAGPLVDGDEQTRLVEALRAALR